MRQHQLEQLDSGHCRGYRSGRQGSAHPCRCKGASGFLRGLAGFLGEALAVQQLADQQSHGAQVDKRLLGLAGLQLGECQAAYQGEPLLLLAGHA
jgi:hypothetical protein